MRVALLWCLLAISVGLFGAMLLALRNYRAHNTVRIHPNAVVEYGWAIVPWLIVALCAAPAVRRLFTAG
jgi:heme/copper-type cytochrome/quinol oxidase subunit 2